MSQSAGFGHSRQVGAEGGECFRINRHRRARCNPAQQQWKSLTA